jgi:hypothetical protein
MICHYCGSDDLPAKPTKMMPTKMMQLFRHGGRKMQAMDFDILTGNAMACIHP